MTNEPHEDSHTPKLKNDVEAQTSPIKETSSQVSGSDTESLLENQTRSIPVQCPNDSKKQQNEIQPNENEMTKYDNGDENISPPEITTSQIKERLVRDDITNELYMPLSSTIVLKRKKEMFYVPLDFKNGLTIDAPVDSGAYVSAIAQKELDRINTKLFYMLPRKVLGSQFLLHLGGYFVRSTQRMDSIESDKWVSKTSHSVRAFKENYYIRRLFSKNTKRQKKNTINDEVIFHFLNTIAEFVYSGAFRSPTVVFFKEAKLLREK